jgi:hypothetical protein
MQEKKTRSRAKTKRVPGSRMTNFRGLRVKEVRNTPNPLTLTLNLKPLTLTLTLTPTLTLTLTLILTLTLNPKLEPLREEI